MNDGIQSTRGYLDRFWANLIDALPGILGAIVILLVGYIVAKVLAKLITKALQAANLDQHLHAGKAGDVVQRAVPRPSVLAGKVTFWIVFLFAVSIAIAGLGIPVLADFVRAIYGYLPNVIAAILIFIVAGAISSAVATLVATTMGDTPTGKLLSTAAPVIIMTLAVFMILTQLKIAPTIVTITYAGIIATLTLAFGLGGKDVANQILQNAYDKGRENTARVKTDMQAGAARGKRKADDLRNRMQ
jgi:hypothetical protein